MMAAVGTGPDGSVRFSAEAVFVTVAMTHLERFGTAADAGAFFPPATAA